MKHTNKELVDTYIHNFQTRSEETFWAFEEVCKIVSSELEIGFELTCDLIESSPDKLTLSYVAAGPIEDLLRFHGTDAIPLIE